MIDVDSFRQPEQAEDWELTAWTTRDDEPEALVAANPWHDEVGKFAPKGTGSRSRIATMPNDVYVKRLPSHPNVGYVQVSGNTVGKVRDRVAYRADPVTGKLYKTGDRSGKEVADVEAVVGNLGVLYGDRMKPYVTVTMDQPPIPGVAGLTRGPSHAKDYPIQESEIEIFAMNTRLVESGVFSGNVLMPSLKTVKPAVYVATHEYGHAHANSLTNEDRRSLDIMWSKHRGGLSAYGRTMPEEAYAEAFAEWHVTNGSTTNADVRAYAEEYGWKTM